MIVCIEFLICGMPKQAHWITQYLHLIENDVFYLLQEITQSIYGAAAVGEFGFVTFSTLNVFSFTYTHRSKIGATEIF